MSDVDYSRILLSNEQIVDEYPIGEYIIEPSSVVSIVSDLLKFIFAIIGILDIFGGILLAGVSLTSPSTLKVIYTAVLPSGIIYIALAYLIGKKSKKKGNTLLLALGIVFLLLALGIVFRSIGLVFSINSLFQLLAFIMYRSLALTYNLSIVGLLYWLGIVLIISYYLTTKRKKIKFKYLLTNKRVMEVGIDGRKPVIINSCSIFETQPKVTDARREDYNGVEGEFGEITFYNKDGSICLKFENVPDPYNIYNVIMTLINSSSNK